MYEFRIRNLHNHGAVVLDGIVRSVAQANIILRAMSKAHAGKANFMLDYKKLDSRATDSVEVILAEARDEYNFKEHTALDG